MYSNLDQKEARGGAAIYRVSCWRCVGRLGKAGVRRVYSDMVWRLRPMRRWAAVMGSVRFAAA